MTRPLDPARGAEAARTLRGLGVKGPLIRAAKLRYITEVTCGMPKCFCPEELGGASHFERRTHPWTDWEPTHEHFPIPRRDCGKATPENTILAHRLCNKLDFFISQGLSIEKDLARVEAAAPNAYAPTTQVSASAWQSSRASPKHTTEPSPSPPGPPAGSASPCNYRPRHRTLAQN